ncbi:MAG: hypothetical protein RMH75_05535 [Archaeoglobaceae archaeon]|nr:hypothetical protein [Archaeoglobaceae archaeon]MDW7990105.1 hypothetical protein [Archaeoglobaceae archaeon]
MKYLFFFDSELEKILVSIKEKARPAFKKLKYVEILAEGLDIVVGKYKSMIFVISNYEIPMKPLERFEVLITTIEEGEKFLYGKYRAGESIEIEAKFEENLFYDILPALFSELTIAKIISKDCMKFSSYISEKASKIKDILKMEAEDQENYAFKLVKERDSFFVTYSDFNSRLKEIEIALKNAEFFSSKLHGFMHEELLKLENDLNFVKKISNDFERTLNEIDNKFNLIYLQIEMDRRKEEFEIHKKTSAITAAAVVIEFVAVAYYSLKVWESYLPVEKLPKPLSFTLLILFTSSVILLTEAIGDHLRNKKKKKLFLSFLAVLLCIKLMIIFPLFYRAV